MNGILLINKPKGITSRDVVNQVCKIFHTKKVGHTGTLDPLATGVLVLCIGKYTKLVQIITSKEKEYVATMQLGVETDTLDNTGSIIRKENKNISKEKIRTTFQNFSKEYEQEVPKYSAVKINGKKLYEYARNNQEVALPKRTVKIKSLEILKIEENLITFRTQVSKGTYIRSLIRDLAKSMGTVAIMTELQRTKQGEFRIENCHNLDSLTIDTQLLSVDDIFTYKEVPISKADYQKVLNGNILNLNETAEKIFVTYQNKKIAIYQKSENGYKILFSLI